MDILRQASETFWSKSVWLPPNTTWADIAPGSRPDVQHANYQDLIWPLPIALGLIVLRHLVEKYWISPIGRSLGIKSSRPRKATANPTLEAAYAKNNRLHHKTVIALTKQTDLTDRQIERWWRYRRAQDKPSTLVKFSECSWRCLYYTSIFAYGLIVLWDKPWFWDVKHCWYGYPHQSVDNDIWWYYMISLAFYWSLTVTQFFDVKRKDFWQMFIHHLVTLLLLSLSWVCNLHRVGSLVLAVHDCADIFLDAAKLTKYANYQKLCDCIFAFFTVIWIVTRLGFYPRVIYSSSVEAPRILPMFPAYYIFNSLLCILLFLHVVWTYVILQVAHTALKSGQMEGDLRSSSSDISDSSETASTLALASHTNGGTPNKSTPTKKKGSGSATNSPKPNKALRKKEAAAKQSAS